MELNIKFNEKMLVEMANRVLDEYEYNGKTIREWADLIANPKTNADRIRAMTDEELVNFVVHHDCCPGFVMDTFSDENRRKYGFDGHSERCECGECCYECWIDWLRQEVEEDEI